MCESRYNSVRGRLKGTLVPDEGMSQVADYSAGFTLSRREIATLRALGQGGDADLTLIEQMTALRGKEAEVFLERLKAKRGHMLSLAGRILGRIQATPPFESEEIDRVSPQPSPLLESGFRVGQREARYMLELGDRDRVTEGCLDIGLCNDIFGISCRDLRQPMGWSDQVRMEDSLTWASRVSLKTVFMIGLVKDEILRQQGQALVADIKQNPALPAAAKAQVRASAIRATGNRR